jgi:hypothetical protein
MNYQSIGATPLSREGYTLKNEHRFLDLMTGELMEFKVGDNLVAYRD